MSALREAEAAALASAKEADRLRAALERIAALAKHAGDAASWATVGEAATHIAQDTLRP